MPAPSMMIDAVAQCDACKATKKIRVVASCKLKPGDPLYTDPNNHDFGRCVRCKRTQMRILEVATSTSTSKPQGFWKIPQSQEDGSSEPSSTTEDEKS